MDLTLDRMFEKSFAVSAIFFSLSGKLLVIDTAVKQGC